MDEILENLKDPSWWFTGIFFIATALIISWLVKKLPLWLKSWSRKSRAKELKKIKNIRRNTWEIHYQIASERSYFLVFTLLCLFYLILLVVTPLSMVFNESILAGIILSSPVFVVEIIWLNRNVFLKTLLKYAHKIA